MTLSRPVHGAGPLYRKLYHAMRQRIERGALTIGAPLPSEAELSREFSASRITVRHALRLLEAEGFVRKERARPTIVVSRKPALRDAWIYESLDDIAENMKGAQFDVVSYGRTCDREAALQLGLPEDARLHLLASRLIRHGRPYAGSRIYFPSAYGRKLRRADFDDVVVFRAVQRRLGIVIASVTHTVWADAATAEDSRLLGCVEGTPMLATRLLYRDENGAPFEIAYTRALAAGIRLSYSIGPVSKPA
jgi:GntR family transcriptional regulator